MQKNWHAVYTRPQYEKKVVSSLTKKKIETFIPMIYVKTDKLMGHKFIYEPLFKSIVFVYTDQAELSSLKQTTGVINLLYWLGKPAIIAPEEIKLIKVFIENYKKIKLEPASVHCEEVTKVYDGSFFTNDGRYYNINNKTVRINLPSLGYALIAEVDDTSFFYEQDLLIQNKRVTYSS